MELLERDRHDHPDFDPLLPQIGCAICGVAVQNSPEAPEAYRAAYLAAPDDETARQVREELEAPMAAWSQAHASEHEEQEHQAHERRLHGPRIYHVPEPPPEPPDEVGE